MPRRLLIMVVLASGLRAETPVVSADEQKFLARVNVVGATNAVAAAALFEGRDLAKASAALDFTLGGLLFQSGRNSEAAAAFSAAVAKAPGFHAARNNLGRARMAGSEWTAAAAAFAALVQAQAADAEIYRLLGQCRLAEEQPVSAETAFRQALLLNPADTPARLGLAQSLMNQGRAADALACAREGLRAAPRDESLWRVRAWAEESSGDAAAAVVTWESMRRLGLLRDADRPRLATLHLAAGRPADAMASLGDDTARAAMEPALLVRAAESFWLAGATGECARVAGWAETRLAAAQSADPAARRSLRRLRAEMSLAAGQVDAAAAVLEESLREDPLDGAALLALASARAAQGRTEEARVGYERAARRPGYEARALLAQARLEAGLSRFARAAELARAALVFDDRADVRRYADQLSRAATP